MKLNSPDIQEKTMKMSLRSEVEVDYSREGGSLLHGMSKFLTVVLCRFFTQASALHVP